MRVEKPHQVITAGIGQTGQCRHHRSAVHQGQSLLGAQHQRLDTQLAVDLGTGAQGATPVGFAFTDQHSSHIGKRRQIATGADRALFGDAGYDVLGQQPVQSLQQRQTDPGNSLRQRAQTGRQHGTPGLDAQIGPQTTAVKTRQVQRQLEHKFRRHRIGHRVTIAGRDAIDHPLFGQQAIEKVGAILDTAAKIGLTIEFRDGLTMGE